MSESTKKLLATGGVLLLAGIVRRDYEAGLANLKDLAETLPSTDFGDIEIERALTWLDALTDQQQSLDYGSQTAHGTRIYNEFEHERLDVACRGYITYLEQIGILSPPQRELLVDRLLALETRDIDVEQIKWVVLMVLFSQPGQELAYARMEDLVFEESAGSVH